MSRMLVAGPKELLYAVKNNSPVKDDAIAQLSDQVMALTARMQEFERKQSLIMFY